MNCSRFAAPQERPSSAAAFAPVDGPLPVLVVDDDPVVRSYFQTVLEEAGMPVLTAANGQEALDVAASGPVGVVVLDSVMPVLDGVATLRQLRERPETETLPVLLVTSRAALGDRVAAFDAGASDYLTKPVEAEELVARVRAHLRASAAWTRVVDEQLAQRAAIASALRGATGEGTPEGAARAICIELGRLRGADGVALLGFPATGTAVTVAAEGPAVAGLRPGGLLPAAVADDLLARATRGPWAEQRGSHTPGYLGPPLRGHVGPATAYAPVRSGGTVHGVLLIAVADGEGVADPARVLPSALAAAIDFAEVAGALLGSALEHRGEQERRRAAVLAALDGKAFTPHFQPVVDLTTEGIVGFELLTRFADGAPPEGRFAEAAALGLGAELELATMERGVAAAATLPEGAFLSLNVSPTFLLARTGRDVLGTRSQRLRPVVLELTEHDRIDDYPAVLAGVADLDRPGLSVDDAGAGYACLHHILALRPDFVKLDRGWVRDLDRDPARQALVAGLRHFAGATGCRLIAEGIETEGELAAMRALGVDLGQGFLLGRPEPAAAAA